MPSMAIVPNAASPGRSVVVAERTARSTTGAPPAYPAGRAGCGRDQHANGRTDETPQSHCGQGLLFHPERPHPCRVRHTNGTKAVTGEADEKQHHDKPWQSREVCKRG